MLHLSTDDMLMSKSLRLKAFCVDALLQLSIN